MFCYNLGALFHFPSDGSACELFLKCPLELNFFWNLLCLAGNVCLLKGGHCPRENRVIKHLLVALRICFWILTEQVLLASYIVSILPGGKGEAGRKDGAGEEAGGRTSCWVDAKRVACC